MTDQLVARFDEERDRLELHRLRIRLQPVGERGATKCVVRTREPVRPIKLSRLLSTGEHGGVALAAMLAELAVVGDRSPLMIDDPVSSLDHDIREQLALRLAEEGVKRESVVLTHDPVFVFFLHEAAIQERADGVLSRFAK